MKGTVKSFRKALREAFEDSMRKPKEEEAFNPEQMGLNPEDESASRERQQASGYLGAVDGPPDYGDDLPWPNQTKEENVEKEGVSQSKRSMHGYDLEDPVDYKDVPGEGVSGVQESFDHEEDDSDQEEHEEEESSEEEKEEHEEEPEEEKEEDHEEMSPFEDDVEEEHMTPPEKDTFNTGMSHMSPQALHSQDAAKIDPGHILDPNIIKKIDPKALSLLKIAMKDRHFEDEAAENPVSQDKAKLIMHHGEVGGNPLSKKQKGLFGAIAGGQKIKK
jgi:hypothetical protein